VGESYDQGVVRERSESDRELSKLRQTADLTIRRVIANFDARASLDVAFDAAYPFAENPLGRQVWAEALRRLAPLIRTVAESYGRHGKYHSQSGLHTTIHARRKYGSSLYY